MEGLITCTNCYEKTPDTLDTCEHCGKPIPEYLRNPNRQAEGSDAMPEVATAALGEDAPASSDELPVAPEPAPAEPHEAPTPALTTAAVRPIVPVPKRPAERMQLLLQRNQKSGMTGKITFTLDVRVALSEDMLWLVKKYKMGKEVLYYKEKVDTSGIEVVSTIGQLGRAIAARALNVSITINDLVKGKHIECKDILEMRAAEEQIKEACANFKEVLQTAAHFGGEEVIDL